MIRTQARQLGQDGAAATEFVLIAPLLVILFFGIIQFGLVMFRSQVVEAAAREGARVASVGLETADIESAVAAAATGFNASDITTAHDDCDDIGDDVTVTVTVDPSAYSFDVPFLGAFAPAYGAQATYRCEKATGDG